jgi:hypothetical protein
LGGNEVVEIGIGEHAARAFLAVADIDVTQRAGSDVSGERLDGTAEPIGGLRCSLESVRRHLARLAPAAGHVLIRNIATVLIGNGWSGFERRGACLSALMLFAGDEAQLFGARLIAGVESIPSALGKLVVALERVGFCDRTCGGHRRRPYRRGGLSPGPLLSGGSGRYHCRKGGDRQGNH